LSIAALSDGGSSRDESTKLLIAFLQEAKKPIEVNVKLDMPEQPPSIVNITNQVPAAQVVVASPLRSIAQVERDQYTQEILRTVTTHEFAVNELQK
jgi:histidinol dehydrogenase